METSVERLRKAREDKECRELAKSLGVTFAKAEAIKGKAKRIPVMEAEVKIDEKLVEKCVIYEGQTAESVAATIAKKHGLDVEAKKAVLAQLQVHFSDSS